MRIFSDFHDYYDGLVTHTTPYFERKTETDLIECPRIPSAVHSKTKYTIPHTIIGFCGEFYIYAEDDEKFIAPIIMNDFISKIKKSKKDRFYYDYVSDKVNRLTEICNKFKNYFYDERVVYFMIENCEQWRKPECRVTRHFDNLKRFNFQRVYDPFSCFQEIEMFIGNNLAQDTQVNQITDSNVLLTAKGFDKKTSFRHPVK